MNYTLARSTENMAAFEWSRGRMEFFGRVLFGGTIEKIQRAERYSDGFLLSSPCIFHSVLSIHLLSFITL
ncbi:hypothetical protein BDV98DRAFT_572142 [Pterulicium gracile]|uniref:Uncharacterized protein n=1 Tax=Pterulicium gracile TaxID=1884261 RepID=A0A5C3QAZ5_9AGAR|nr:hypothetical protein BDV98DRAFT_572142 [Pterula gracilis]